MSDMHCNRFLLVALCAFAVAPVSHAEDKAATQARLQRADAATRLDDPELKPWYLKVNFSLFDDSGKLAEQGTLEEWWAGPSLYKRTITSPSYTSTTIVNKTGHFRTAGTPQTPFLLEQLERQIVHPMPGDSEVSGSSPQLQKPAEGSPPIDCVMLNQPLRGVPFPQIGLFPTYCMVPGKDMVQVSYDYGSFMALRSAMGMFQKRVIPIDLALSLNRVQAVASHLVMLKVAPLTDADFVAGTGMEPVDPQRVHAEYRDLKATQIANIAPVVPVGVKPSAMSEPVVVRVRLGTDGRVHFIRLVQTPDPLLATSAMAAVLRWTFEPHLVDGKPAEVEMNIPVMFSKGLGEKELGRRN
jgi:TonB family protein